MLANSSHKALAVALAAAIAMMASSARSEPTTGSFSTISVDNGNGGWQPYVPPAAPPVTHANPSPPRGKRGMNASGP